MAKIVTFYNNKGGVSKTTTLFNLAVFLTRRGKRVLIADCDPQCNATEMFFASNEVIDDPDRELPGTSIYQALRPRFAGEIARVDPAKVELAASSLYEGLHLLRGDFEFSMAESYFANAWNMAITENMHEKNTYVSLYRLLHALGQEHGFHYVLCDVGPSTGAITRMVVLACDGFFVPLTPDRFCNQAVKVLGHVLKEWISKHADISRTFAPYRVASFPGIPLMLGAIIQNFKVHSATKAKVSYQKWQDRISATMASSFFETNSIPVSEKVNRADPFVATIRDVGPLSPVAQMFGRAIFDIERRHTEEASTTGAAYGGVVWKNWEERMAQYEGEVEKIAEMLP
jgi:cellulose biosynthesis protein BcsQ